MLSATVHKSGQVLNPSINCTKNLQLPRAKGKHPKPSLPVFHTVLFKNGVGTDG